MRGLTSHGWREGAAPPTARARGVLKVWLRVRSRPRTAAVVVRPRPRPPPSGFARALDSPDSLHIPGGAHPPLDRWRNPLSTVPQDLARADPDDRRRGQCRTQMTQPRPARRPPLQTYRLTRTNTVQVNGLSVILKLAMCRPGVTFLCSLASPLSPLSSLSPLSPRSPIHTPLSTIPSLLSPLSSIVSRLSSTLSPLSSLLLDRFSVLGSPLKRTPRTRCRRDELGGCREGRGMCGVPEPGAPRPSAQHASSSWSTAASSSPWSPTSSTLIFFQLSRSRTPQPCSSSAGASFARVTSNPASASPVVPVFVISLCLARGAGRRRQSRAGAHHKCCFFVGGCRWTRGAAGERGVGGARPNRERAREGGSATSTRAQACGNGNSALARYWEVHVC